MRNSHAHPFLPFLVPLPANPQEKYYDAESSILYKVHNVDDTTEEYIAKIEGGSTQYKFGPKPAFTFTPWGSVGQPFRSRGKKWKVIEKIVESRK
jgi:hypothetical protein